jgi:hypothetical protein
MKPVLKVPGSMLLKLTYDGPLSSFAFIFNLRRYTMSKSKSSSSSVGRCRLTLSKPELKARLVSELET